MQQTEDLASRPEFKPIIDYGNGVRSHLSVIRGRTVIPPKSRSAVIGKHEALRAAEDLHGTPGREEAPTVSYIFTRAPASRVPLAELKKIALAELRWCEIERKRVLVVRTATQPCVVEGALCSVIEDESGAVHNLRLYNVDFSDARNILPLGIVLAIKEPYCEAATEETSGVRVDHPSDLVYLSEGDPHFPDSWRASFPNDISGKANERLKDEGNELYRKGLVRLALCKYTAAIRRDPAPALKLSVLLNRSQSYLLLREYDSALSDAEEIIKQSGEQLNEKALFRASRALSALGRYDEAQSYLERLTAAFVQNREAKTTLRQTKLRIAEKTNGKYDWSFLIGEAKKAAPRLEIADYMGPVSLSKEGVLVAKQEIKAGDILLVSKAIEVLYPSDMNDQRSALIYDTTRGVLNRGEGSIVTQKIASKILQNPAIGNTVYPLSEGLEIYDDEVSSGVSARRVDGRAVIDIHMLDAIRESYVAPFPTLHPIVQPNFTTAQGIGLWPLGTRVHLKHSCLPNACRSFIGDVLVLRACRNIPRGEPISIAHVYPSLPLAARQTELARAPGTPCTCRFCEIEEEEGVEMRQRRADLVQKVKELSERAPPNQLRTDPGRDTTNAPSEDVVQEVVKEVLAICDELESTFAYPSTIQPRFPLLEPLAYLFDCYLFLGPSYTEDALKTNARYLTSLGFSFEYLSAPDAKQEQSSGGDVRLLEHGFYHPFIVKTLVQQSSVCWQLRKRRTAAGWRRIAENVMEIITGHRSLFKETYGKVYEGLGWEL